MIYEVGGAEVWCIAGTGYPIGTPKKDAEEWFYIEDVPLFDPAQRGLPEFSLASPKKLFNWRPKGSSQEESAEVTRLAAQVRWLAHNGLTIIDVMAAAIARCVQPLQQRVHPLWCYNGANDSTRYTQKGPADQAAMAAVLADLFKGEEQEFARLRPKDGFSSYKPIEVVSPITLHSSDGTPIFLNRIFNLSEQSWRRWIETVSCPVPQPKSHSREDDPGFHDDPETSIDFEEGVFYQESLDGSKVALLADAPRAGLLGVVIGAGSTVAHGSQDQKQGRARRADGRV
jgi:hypothetical protein